MSIKFWEWDWEDIAKFGKNKFVTRAYIFIFLLPFAITTLKELKLQEFINAIPFSWHIFFLSAIFFTIATILYYSFVPKIVKDNKNFAEFLDQGMGFMKMNEYFEDLDISMSEYLEKMEQYLASKPFDESKIEDKHFEEFVDQLGLDIKEKKRYRLIYNIRSMMKYPLAPWDVSHFTTAKSNSQKETYDMELKYSDEIRKNEIPNMRTTFWFLFDYAKEEYLVERIFCSFFFALGSIGISWITLNSVIIVFGHYRFEIFKGVLSAQ